MDVFLKSYTKTLSKEAQSTPCQFANYEKYQFIQALGDITFFTNYATSSNLNLINQNSLDVTNFKSNAMDNSIQIAKVDR
jgi:hypothetical protein